MSKKRFNILFLSSWYPNKKSALTGNFIKRHASVVAINNEVSVVYVCSAHEPGIEETTEEGVFTIRGYYKKSNFGPRPVSLGINALKYLIVWQKALRIYRKKKGKPDLIHAHIVYPLSILAALLKACWHVPYIVSEQWSGYLPEDGRYNTALIKFVSRIGVKHASAITAISHDLKNWMQKAKLANRYYVISNVVDISAFNISPRRQREQGECKFIHITSFYVAEKNTPAIIRAFGRVCKDFPLATLTLKGEGLDNPEVLKLCDTLHLKNNLAIIRADAPEPLNSLLQRMDVSVMFSDFETQSVVLLEALCCGKPVISSNIRAVAEFVNDKNGILVERRNEEQLYKALVSIIRKLDTYNPEEIRKSIVDIVSPEAVAARFQEVYNDVLKTG